MNVKNDREIGVHCFKLRNVKNERGESEVTIRKMLRMRLER